jgi:hypothetical protein
MATHETGKQRASRIPLDYFKRPNAVERWKLWLTAIALLLTVGWLGWGFVRSDQGRMRYSRGPVASVHATWEAQCDACHISFTPIDSSPRDWTTPFLGKAHGSDARCETCHAGPPHHETQKAESTPACAGCHRDHRGRDASLVRVADSDCTHCHANLKAHMTGEPGFANAVTAFAEGNHPEFRLHVYKSPDPGKLKFNHKLHMTAGLTLTEGGKPWTLAEIKDEVERARYRQPGQQGNNVPVQLECASCHQVDSGDFRIKGDQLAALPPGTLPKGTTGAYMVPITYENQCKACHPLTFDPSAPNLAVPHRLQPDEVNKFLWGAYASEFIKKRPELAKSAGAPFPPLPGQDLSEADKKAREEIKNKVVAAEQFLYRDSLEAAQKLVFGHKKTCGECHHYQVSGPGAVPKQIEPPQVPDVWFRHAGFNHATHRAVNCRECHARAYADDQNPSTVSNDVLIPNLANCVQCHSPRREVGGALVGGARTDCVECHRYHHGSKEGSVQGVGATARAPRGRLDLRQFLSGTPAAGEAKVR